MENSVLGNALEGVPEEEEDEEKPKDSNVENTENIDGGKYCYWVSFCLLTIYFLGKLFKPLTLSVLFNRQDQR